MKLVREFLANASRSRRRSSPRSSSRSFGDGRFTVLVPPVPTSPEPFTSSAANAFVAGGKIAKERTCEIVATRARLQCVGRRPGRLPPHSGRYFVAGAAGAAGAAVPCFALCFTCRHSARVFSSPALHACFAARPALRSSRRSSRRSMPCVWPYTGTAPASATSAAKTPTPLRRFIIGRMLFSFRAAVLILVARSLSKKQTRSAVPVHRAMCEYSPVLRESASLQLRSSNSQGGPRHPATPVAGDMMCLERGPSEPRASS